MRQRVVSVRPLFVVLSLALFSGCGGCGGESTEIPEDMDIPGFIDGADVAKVHGWAWDRKDISKSVSLDIYVNDEKVATINADKRRNDLPRKGPYGFVWATPKELKDGLKEGKDYKIHVIIPSTGEQLLAPDSDHRIIKGTK